MSQAIVPLPTADAISITARAMVASTSCAAEQRNVTRAEYNLLRGIQIVATKGGFLVPSATTSNAVYLVSHYDGCCCKAAQANRGCWHTAALAIIERAVNVVTLPAKPRVRITAEQVHAGQVARIQRLISTARRIVDTAPTWEIVFERGEYSVYINGVWVESVADRRAARDAVQEELDHRAQQERQRTARKTRAEIEMDECFT